jgi:hypothetical protein
MLLFSKIFKNVREYAKFNKQLQKYDSLLFVLAMYTLPVSITNLSYYHSYKVQTALKPLVVSLVSINITLSALLVFTWLGQYKQTIIRMLKGNSYLMMTCAKYGINYDLVIRNNKKKLEFQ